MGDALGSLIGQIIGEVLFYFPGYVIVRFWKGKAGVEDLQEVIPLVGIAFWCISGLLGWLIFGW